MEQTTNKPTITTAQFNQYVREWRRSHPEKQMEYRISAAIALLRRKGYTVTKEEEGTK